MVGDFALLYLKHRLHGIPNKRKIQHVVIDEAQDFSVFQIYALKEALGTSIFTILGDLAQGIHRYRGIGDWQEVIDYVFPEDRCQFRTLEKSYRTTVEIMECANEVIDRMEQPGVLPAQPVVRHGEKPRFKEFDTLEEGIHAIRDELNLAQANGYGNVAIIGRSLQECEKIQRALMTQTDFSVQLLTGEEKTRDVDVVLVPSHVVKGLEFDYVILVTWEESFSENELDLKLLYVSMTRPLHRLTVLARKNSFPLLNRLNPVTTSR
ncbi:UvrD-like helicase family protein [Melghirimyces profundicolus]|uniref:DNA 3'-5' helicase n=1 Tax=Melghirimyces profundicolus TaxID=1242148 RepID=A0A2T6BUD4_9BACL|nr:3'-5' exonuclease [Melghirimyces profundicolus]PTX59577.1 UvrD-like helicase family protein [Melghirimyces profundicolus]